MLTEDARQQYLQAMDIQTWYDPGLVLPDIPASELGDEATVDPVIKDVQTESTIKTQELTDKPLHDNRHVESEQNKPSCLADINVAIETCQLCELHTSRKQTVSGQGKEQSNIVVIVDAPVNDNNNEFSLLDQSAKNMLHAMLKAINMASENVYITSLVKCLPPEQRTPYTSEMICCDEHLSAQIQFVQPDCIFILGEVAAQQLLVSQKPLMELRLRHHQHLGIPVVASYHPEALLASAETKRKVWQDLLQIKKYLN